MSDYESAAPTIPLEPPPAPTTGRRKLLLWIGAGLGTLLLIQLCALLVILVVFPSARSRLAGLVGRPAAPPDAPVTAQSTRTGPVLIEDTFDQATTRWDQSAARVTDGTYELRVDIPNYDTYGLFLGQPEIDDFDLALDVQQVAGDPTSEYGIRFRQTGPGDYLMFSISGSGYYRLARVHDNVYSSIVPWTYDRQIKTGQGAVNHLRVVAKDAAITGWINDTQLLQAKDDQDVGGQLTLGATTFNSGGLVVRFDNLVGQAGGANLKEDFSNAEQAAWSVGGATIVNGGYEITTNGSVRTWQQPLPSGSSNVGDFSLSVDATLIKGAEGGASYGVMFGDGGSFDFYSLYLYPEGGISLFRSEPGGQETAIIPPLFFEAVKAGTGQTNTIKIEVRGDVLKINLNGQQVPDLKMDAPIKGMVGVIASGGGTGDTQVRFDNFRLEELHDRPSAIWGIAYPAAAEALTPCPPFPCAGEGV